MAATKQSLYDILGVARDANELDIGLAHQRRMLELQRAMPPDPSRIAFVTQAYEVLSDPKRRAAYDASLITQQEKAEAAAQAATPDLVLEGDDEEELKARSRWLMPVGIGIAVVAVIIIAIRMGQTNAPPKAPPAEVAEAPK